jgi:hypothetical protein
MTVARAEEVLTAAWMSSMSTYDIQVKSELSSAKPKLKGICKAVGLNTSS